MRKNLTAKKRKRYPLKKDKFPIKEGQLDKLIFSRNNRKEENIENITKCSERPRNLI